MNIFTAYLDAMRRYVDFDGRTSRSQYWFFVLVFYGGGILLLMLLPNDFFQPTLVILFLVHALPSLAITVRRLHDFDASGWWMLLHGVLGILFSIGIGCLPSSEGDNSYGPSPHSNPLDKLTNTFE